MRSWGPAIRMGRRDLRRHKVRAALTCALVALPVMVGTVAALVAHNERWDAERAAQSMMLDADASLVVTPYTAVRPRSAVGWNPRPTSAASERDARTVDVLDLLPEGSAIAPRPESSPAMLTSGGTAHLLRADLDNPLTASVATVTAGRAPKAADEVAVPRAVATELGLLGASGDVLASAALELFDGQRLKVVGVAQLSRWEDSSMTILAPVDSVAPAPEAWRRGTASYLVDLPPMGRFETRTLVAELAGQGLALRPRDAVLHPRAWGVSPEFTETFDPTPVLVGALCVLVGLIEVVLLVGAAFAVAARRQVRDLGLLAANGGAGRDVRRVLLAQGLVLGVLSSVVGAALGVVAFRYGAEPVAERLGREQWGLEISWLAVAVITVLGSLTSVVAALLPGLRASRLTPVQALSGRFPIRSGEARAHRPAFVLAAGGLLLLAVGGWATATAGRRYPNWVGVAAFTTGLGMLVLVAGVVWSTPYVVRRVSALGRALPLSGRYAFRDAGRHRFRTAAAVMALMITVAGAVLAGFGFRSAERSFERSYDVAANSLAIELWDDTGDVSVRLAAAKATIERIADPVSIATSYVTSQPGGRERRLLVLRDRHEVRAVDEESLRAFVRVDDEVMETFRSGGAVTSAASVVRAGHIELGLYPGQRRPENRWTLPAAQAVVLQGTQPGGTRSTFISIETAQRLGLVTRYGSLFVRTPDPVGRDVLDRLAVYGISAWSSDPERVVMSRLQYAGLGVAALLTALVVGIAVAMAAAEGRDDVATLAAVGAGPMRRRTFGAMHGLFLGIVGSLLGAGVGVPAGLAFTQVDGLPGVDMAWVPTFGTVVVVLLLSWVMGALVTPSRFRLTRRVA